jgi:peptidoglycan hydrolase FlgJ
MELKGFTNANRLVGQRGNADMHHLKGAKTPDEQRQALRRVAQEFEAIFLRQMIDSMRKTVDSGGLLEKNHGEQLFESLLDEEWSRKLAARGGAGSFGDLLYRQLSRQFGLAEEAPGLTVGKADNDHE